MEVLNLEADLFNYNKFNNYIHDDYQVLVRYETEHSYTIIVVRLDSDNGWGEDLYVLVNYMDINRTEVIYIGPSPSVSKKEIHIQRDSISFVPSTIPIIFLPSYKLAPFPEPKQMLREEFNTHFSTDIVCLPKELYAIGLDNDKVYMYNHFYADYYEILQTVQHIICTALTFTPYRKFYFLFSAKDGYLEDHFYTNRTEPYIVGVDEFKNKKEITLSDPTIYPVWHSKRYICAMANQKGIPYTISVPDKHVFYCDLYNGFRSIHRGIPFSQKINKIIYAGRLYCGTNKNFLTRRDISINQREYFMSDTVPKTNIVCACDGTIQSDTMVHYKYILDIDGRSATWDATAWKLNSGSVIFKTDSCWRQWFYDEYKPWVHYIPIKEDFSDIDAKYAWCEAHPNDCEHIVRNAKKLFQKVYRLDSIFKYTIKVIELLI